MSCESYTEAIIELARGPRSDTAPDPVTAARCRVHMEACRHCTALFDEQRRLTDRLASLRTIEAAATAPATEARLLTRFAAEHAGRATNRARRLVVAVAAAAVLVLGVGVVVNREVAPRPALTSTSEPAIPSVVAVQQAGTAFIPLLHAGAAHEGAGGTLVRMDMSAAMLAGLGIAWPGETDGTVTTDVWLGSDGVARGIRVVYHDR